MDAITGENNQNLVAEETVYTEKLEEYTQEERQDIFLAPFYSYFLASASDGGIIAAAREFAEFDRVMVDSLEQLKGNKLVEASFWNLDSEAKRKDAHQKIKTEGQNFEAVKQEFFPLIKRAVEITKTKACKKDAGEYLYFIYDIADRVVNASGEGFLGTGEKVSPKEKEFLEEFRNLLGLGSSD
ncbi:MAG: hypothetical protein LWY06_14980 [Firmicutes bacterium]|nr:hypothetical protein [Bacillota bacterium]